MARSYRAVPAWEQEVDSSVITACKPRFTVREATFRCRQCRRMVAPLPWGGQHRNHCPYCLHSRHVDVHSGDRMSDCGATMAPVGAFQRPDGEYVIVHRCLGCAIERFCRIAADDDFALAMALPVVAPRTSREMKAASRLDGVMSEDGH